MIKINLLGKKGNFKVPIVMGMDLSNLSILGWAIAIAFYFISEPLLTGYLEKELKVEKNKVAVQRKKLKTINKKIRAQRNLSEEIKLYKKRITLLKLKSDQVEKVIKSRTNPMKLLLHLARNIPSDLWINNMVMDNKTITIEGASASYKSIGNFMNNANSSIYFNQSLTLPTYETKHVKGTGKGSVREEVFKMTGRIERYE